jgi:DNA-binding GntR family transcriptional regulator
MTSGLASRPVRSLADQVYDRLRRSIVSGELATGTRMVELDIAGQMGTSQGPVREALQRLEREGLVQRQAHSATFVSALALDEMYELFSIRSLIEGFAIRRTVECITPEQCDQLDHLVELMRDEGQREDMLGLTVYDMEFHRLICKWSGNATLLRAWDPLYSQIQRFVVLTHKDYFASVTDVADTHIPIVASLRSHAIEQVTPLMQQHIMLIWSLFARGDPKHASRIKESEDATDGSYV